MALRSSQARARFSTRLRRLARDQQHDHGHRSAAATATMVKKSHWTREPAVDGSVSEIGFSAIGMKPPGFASSAPAPMIAIAGTRRARSSCRSPTSSERGSAAGGRGGGPDDQQHREDHVEHRDPCLRARRGGRGGDVAEHERGRDADGDRRGERAEQEPAAAAGTAGARAPVRARRRSASSATASPRARRAPAPCRSSPPPVILNCRRSSGHPPLRTTRWYRLLLLCRSTNTSVWSASPTSRSSSAARSRLPAPTAQRPTSRGSSPPSPSTA